MRRFIVSALTLVAAFSVLALAGAPLRAQGPPQRPGMPGGPGGPGMPGGMQRPGIPGGAGGPMAAATDSFAADRDSVARIVLDEIAGRENVAAESVFKNVKLMRGMPAGQLVRSMNFGFGRGLGVRCAHCHIENHWADEDKPAKQVTRDMMAMTHAINDTLLMRIKFKDDDHPRVGCFTCHRGHPNPNYGQRPRGDRGPQGGPGGREGR